jgi:hypothetical protein
MARRGSLFVGSEPSPFKQHRTDGCHNRHVIGSTRQWRGHVPAILAREVDMAVGAIHAALAVAAHNVQPPGPGGSPRHLAARQGQWCLRDPVARGTSRCWTHRRALRFLAGHEVVHHRAAFLEPGEGRRGGQCRNQGGRAVRAAERRCTQRREGKATRY